MSEIKGPLLLLILLALASVVSCSHTPSKPPRPQVAPHWSAVASPSPAMSVPPRKSDRLITIHALDNEYHSTTAILRDNRLDHQKGSHD